MEEIDPSEPVQIVLENHGLIVSGSSADLVIRRTEELVEAGKSYFGAIPADALDVTEPSPDLQEMALEFERAAAGSFQTGLTVRPTINKLVTKAATESALWLTSGPIVPDNVMSRWPRVFESQSAGEAVELIREIPQPLLTKTVIVLNNKGVFYLGRSQAAVEAMEETLLAHALIRNSHF